MLLFKDVISGDELVSDAYDLKEVDDIVYEADCQMVNVKQGGDIDIGANPSAEDGGDDVEEGVETVNNLVYSFRLNQTSFDKKSYMTYIKGYMKAIKARLQESNPDRVPVFEKNAVGYIKKILGNFKDYDFYTGESMDPDGMVVLLNYREDGVTPYMTFFKDGLLSEKF
ncbi:translationally controlled tumor protein [Schizosaccharomyces japonicus yFS275]|uniref:Translationally-controlled tumor protein homolog n=1 Tax=Schizosaccharomyces japonicus (strain yFS275 / FY16936) TaxID=402676 RepID=B6K163_SCHJY|nr:translationally controlled tumor protein [Schizosaccharomyces japonicus yFS275]EEB07684.1 translationally controlled tumor protein [Schizosaccharomyces japonicus yFS275]